MKGKKAQEDIGWGFILHLILGVIIFVAIIGMVSCIFRLSDQAKESFSGLVAEIDKLTAVEEGKSAIPLRIDADTAIVGWGNNSDGVVYVIEETGGISTAYHPFKMKKPQECKANSSCICLCQKVSPEIKSWSRFMPKFGATEATCEKLLCKSYTNFDFFKDRRAHEKLDEKSGGFIISRLLVHGALANGEIDPTRLKSITIEKYKNVIDVCTEDSCLSDDDKAKIDYGSEPGTYNAVIGLEKAYDECSKLVKEGGQSKEIEFDIGTELCLVFREKDAKDEDIYLMKHCALNFKQREKIRKLEGIKACEQPTSELKMSGKAKLEIRQDTIQKGTCCAAPLPTQQP
jgi:hypothetical protein